jgi:hypothetical protein
MNDNKNQPPRLALKFLEWFCPPNLFEGIEGDLMEEFESEVKTLGIKKARRNFVWRAIQFFRPAILFRNKFRIHLIDTIMWRSYFTITYRNVLKNKGYSFINILGLRWE